MRVSVQYLRPMRDAFFFMYHLAAATDQSDAIPPSLSQLTGSFAILPIAQAVRNDSSYRANSGCPRFSDLCDRKSVKRSVTSFLSPEMRYLGQREEHAHLFVSHVVNFMYLWLPKRLLKIILHELGYSVKKFTHLFYIKSCKLLKNIYSTYFF